MEVATKVCTKLHAWAKSKTAAVVAVASAGVMSMPAHAAVDLTDITAAGTDIAAVGGAVFALYIGIKLFKWIRRAL